MSKVPQLLGRLDEHTGLASQRRQLGLCLQHIDSDTNRDFGRRIRVPQLAIHTDQHRLSGPDHLLQHVGCWNAAHDRDGQLVRPYPLLHRDAGAPVGHVSEEQRQRRLYSLCRLWRVGKRGDSVPRHAGLGPILQPW